MALPPKRKVPLMAPKSTTLANVKAHSDGVALDNATRAAVTALANARATIKAAEEAEAEAKATILAALGDKSQGLIGGQVVVKLAERTRSGIDSKALLQGFPEAHAACSTSTTYTIVQTL